MRSFFLFFFFLDQLSNAPKNVKGKGGFVYEPYATLCLETQRFADARNQPIFPSIIVPRKPY